MCNCQIYYTSSHHDSNKPVFLSTALDYSEQCGDGLHEPEKNRTFLLFQMTWHSESWCHFAGCPPTLNDFEQASESKVGARPRLALRLALSKHLNLFSSIA